MIQSIQIRTYVAATLACLLAASCSDLTDSDSLPDVGTYPMIFTAAVDAPIATRATVDNSWEGTEKVAVMVDGEVKKYKVAGNGALTPDGAGNSHYWSSTQPMTVQAWYSSAYSGTRPASFTVQSNQSNTTGYQQSDMLYAIQSATYNRQGSVSLTFKHLPAKVVVNLKQGDGVTEEEVKSSTVTLINQTLTSGTININENSQTCTVAQVANGLEEITPQSTTSATSDYKKAVQALLVPQQIKDKPFIKVTINRNAATRDYYYTPTSDTEVNLNAGKQYTYNITVKETGLVVTLSESDAWGNGGNTDVTSKELVDGYSASDLKPGDYYYSDGSISDGGYRKYANNTTATLDIRPVLTNPKDGKVRSVIGIVFWVGDPTDITPANAAASIGDKTQLQGDATLQAFHPDCTHGLVVALQDARSETTWQNPAASVQNWLNTSSNNNYMTNSGISGSYLPVQSGSTNSDAPANNIQGYNNTKAIEAFNVAPANSSNKVTPVEMVVDYRKKVSVPEECSGWYLPSVKELTLLCGTDVSDIYNNGSGGTDNRDLMKAQLSKVSGTSLQSGYYWSSTDDDDDWAWGVRFSYGDVGYGSKSLSWYGVRAVLAF